MECTCRDLPEDENKFWCQRHQIYKTKHWADLCKEKGSYWRAWEKGRGPGQAVPKDPNFTSKWLLCKYRGKSVIVPSKSVSCGCGGFILCQCTKFNELAVLKSTRNLTGKLSELYPDYRGRICSKCDKVEILDPSDQLSRAKVSKPAQQVYDSNTMKNAQDLIYQSVINGAGPGSQLWHLLSRLGIQHTPDCSCLLLAETMNDLGPQGCRDQKDKLLKLMRKNQKKYGWSAYLKAGANMVILGWIFKLNPLDPLPGLLDKAIELAEQVQ